MSQQGFDPQAASGVYSVELFNQTWDLIDKTERTPEEEDAMLQRAFASAWHWTQRSDCQPRNLCMSHWQLSRVLALVGDAFLAGRYASSSLDLAKKHDLGPFLLGYAYEALARAASLGGNQQEVTRCLERARELAEKVESADDRKLLVNDLATIR